MRRKTPARAQGIRDWLTAVQTEAGFPIKGPHFLRHTFCSHLAMKGAPARAIQKLAGHQSVVMTPKGALLVANRGGLLGSARGKRYSELPPKGGLR